MPGLSPLPISESGNLPEDPRLAKQHVGEEMQKIKVSLQQLQEKLAIDQIGSIKKDDVEFYIREIIRFVVFVRQGDNEPYVDLFLKSPQGFCTHLRRGREIAIRRSGGHGATNG